MNVKARILELEARVDYLEGRIDTIMAGFNEMRDYVLKLKLEEIDRDMIPGER